MSAYKNSMYSSTADAAGDTTYGTRADVKQAYGTATKYTSNINSNSTNGSTHHTCSRADDAALRRCRSDQRQSTYLFWALVLLLFILAFGNLVLTFVILSVLRLGQGMESLELVPAESLIKFFGDTDLDNIYKRDGKLEGFNGVPMEIRGDIGDVQIGILETEREYTPVINFGQRLETIRNVESFNVRHPATGKSLFSTDFPNFGLPRGVDKLDVETVLTGRVSSAVDRGLLIKSDTYVKLKGSEGIHVDGKEVIFSADQDIFLKSVNKSIVLSGLDGVFVDVKNLPVGPGKARDTRTGLQYKICVCMPEGKLFRLPVPPGQSSPVNCLNVDRSVLQNPCL